MNTIETEVVKDTYLVAEVEMEISKSDGIVNHVLVEVTPKVDNVWRYTECCDSVEVAKEFVAKKVKLLELVDLMNKEVVEMENYSYYGSNPGIPQDSIEDIAERVIKFFEDRR